MLKVLVKRHVLANALLAAAHIYDQDARDSREVRVANSFMRQAAEARKLAEQVEQADAIKLED